MSDDARTNSNEMEEGADADLLVLAGDPRDAVQRRAARSA